MKVFISQKMSGLTEKEVMETRNKAMAHLKSVYGDNIEMIENYHHENVPDDAGRIWHLGESIKMLEKADIVYFCDGWEEANGCIIERDICKLYNIPIFGIHMPRELISEKPSRNYVVLEKLKDRDTSGIIIERAEKTGAKSLNNVERLILGDLFMQQVSPSPYTIEYLKPSNDNRLVLYASFKHRDDEDNDIITDLACKDVMFSLDARDINFEGTADDIWGQIYTKYHHVWQKELTDKVYNSIGNSWEDLMSVPYYNGLSSTILSWKQLKSTDSHSVQCPDNCGSCNDLDAAQLQVFWMIAVEKFGDYGTSPRSGWIESENWDAFCEWCDAICMESIMASLTCTYNKKYDKLLLKLFEYFLSAKMGKCFNRALNTILSAGYNPEDRRYCLYYSGQSPEGQLNYLYILNGNDTSSYINPTDPLFNICSLNYRMEYLNPLYSNRPFVDTFSEWYYKWVNDDIGDMGDAYKLIQRLRELGEDGRKCLDHIIREDLNQYWLILGKNHLPISNLNDIIFYVCNTISNDHDYYICTRIDDDIYYSLLTHECIHIDLLIKVTAHLNIIDAVKTYIDLNKLMN